MRCNQVTIFIERFGEYVSDKYPNDVQRISVYCDDSKSIYAALSQANLGWLIEHIQVGTTIIM